MRQKTETGINWAVTPGEAALIQKIAERALQELPWGKHRPARLTLLMDLTACHLNGTPLRLEGLLLADETELAHDVGGIVRHIDRTTGKLEDHFLPLYAVHQTIDAEDAPLGLHSGEEAADA